ncbi:uncharacterized protein LOC112504634 [Cynara cardunculus var. scolymus]|uniref:Uncharacterized protein n=1 Tax=Cynara cardunculus var. scolymus TaxID=59895 RepID=A0A103S4T4_CYNCS|nr:uncharacterized protein LOC112504634 [Cynara cardunculus var. scolymus]KVG79634.1 hypothetical protein Ccrd_026194 [Cynara cardunculus var. scolymus]
MATSSRKSKGSVLPLASMFHCSILPSGRFASSTTAGFYSSPSSSYIHRRPTSSTRVNLHGLTSMTSSSVSFSIENRSGSAIRSMVVSPRDQVVREQNGRTLPKKMCMCSQTMHPGSFRCSLRKTYNNSHSMTSYSPNRLNARRSAMTNSLVRIATVEGGDLVKRALAALIRPSSHQQRQRSAFQPRPSRLSILSNADDS